MGLRQRLNRIEANAHHTMSDAQLTLAAFKELADELTDGVNFKIVRKGNASLMDFVMGKVDELPIEIRVVPKEEDEPQRETSPS